MSDTNDTNELFNTGKKYYNEGNFEEAAKWYQKAAEQGDAQAQQALARLNRK